jgi:hypothetical protein
MLCCAEQVGLAEAAVALGKVEAAHAAGGGCSADHAAAALTHYRELAWA